MIIGFVVPRGDWTRRSRYLKIRDRESYTKGLAG
jgi:CO/xanthine dehydrogenase FAD-binding subunit